jgi:hypothetical protein
MSVCEIPTETENGLEGESASTLPENEARHTPSTRTEGARFIGVDLHKCSVTLAAVNAAGETIEVVTRATKCVDRIERWLAELPGPTWMAVESVGFAEWFIDRYRDSVDRIDLSN